MSGNLLPIVGQGFGASLPVDLGTVPRITSLLIKPASAVCNLDCAYCFYLDRDADPYKALPAPPHDRRDARAPGRYLPLLLLPHTAPSRSRAGSRRLPGLRFFENLVEFQKQYGRDGQNVSNALQTNGVLLDHNWCDCFANTTG